MSTISIDDVKKLAKLSSLKVDEQEATGLAKELQSIIDLFDELEKVDTSAVEPTSQVTGLTNVTRSDEVKDYGVDREALLSNVPHTENGYIKVKRVMNE